MRKVFLDNLPHLNGNLSNRIDWVASIGYDIKFSFDNIEGSFLINDYILNKRKLEIIYNNNKYNIGTSSLLQCKIASIIDMCNYYRSEYKYQIGDVVGRCNNMRITKLTTKKNNKGNGKYSYNKAYECTCLNCKNTTIKSESDLFTGCKYCGDGRSFPEKSFYALCLQLKELGLISMFDIQYCPDWAKIHKSNKNYKVYDFKTYNKDAIIETHGDIHYRKTYKRGKDNLFKIQENDRFKETLAKQNINYPYIIIDVRESTIEWFRNSVINSIMPSYYGFNADMIDWNRIFEFSILDNKRQILDLWENCHNIQEIANTLDFHPQSIRRCLMNYAILDMCDYNPEIESIKARKKATEQNKKRVICLNNGEIFNSIIEASYSQEIPITPQSIGQCCIGKAASAGKSLNGTPLQWKFVSDYEVNKDDNIFQEYVFPNSKSVICITTGEIFSSITEAGEKYNISPTGISKCCLNKLVSAGKHPESDERLQWLYYSDYIRLTYNEVKKIKISLKSIKDFTSKKVICIDTNSIYTTIKNASITTGLPYHNIYN